MTESHTTSANHRIQILQEDSLYVALEITSPDGANRRITLPKRLKLWAPDKFPRDTLEKIAFRNFDFSTPRDLLFEFDRWNGLGDIVVGSTSIWGVRNLLQRKRALPDFRIFASLSPERFEVGSRYFAALGILDDYIDPNKLADYKFRPELEKFDGGVSVANPHFLSLGNTWNCLWAKWGMPGPFTEYSPRGFSKKIRAHQTSEWKDFGQSNIRIAPDGYILLCPETSWKARPLKAWPQAYWHEVLKWILDWSPLKIVIVTQDPEFYSFAKMSDRIQIYDPKFVMKADLLKLAVLVQGARAVVALDSCPAHLAGVLGVPCVALFGPSAPNVWGHPNNQNLRVSSCPPCMVKMSFYVCNTNVCMRELKPKSVITALALQLSQLQRNSAQPPD